MDDFHKVCRTGALKPWIAVNKGVSGGVLYGSGVMLWGLTSWGRTPGRHFCGRERCFCSVTPSWSRARHVFVAPAIVKTGFPFHETGFSSHDGNCIPFHLALYFMVLSVASDP